MTNPFQRLSRWLNEKRARRYINEKRAEFGFWNSLIRVHEPEWIEYARKKYGLPDTWMP